MSKRVPRYIQFISAGFYITLISTITKIFSPEMGAVVYSLPWNFLLVLFFLIRNDVSIEKIMSFTVLGGIYGLIGSIIFIGTMLVYVAYNKYKDDDNMKFEEILKVIIAGFILWSLFSLILFLQKTYK